MRSLRPLLAAATLTAFAVAYPSPPRTPALPSSPNEAVGVMKSDPTTRGSFDGTWMYVNRDARFALWVRTKEGKKQVRIQYQSLASPEAFETDWDGRATYYMAGQPVTFEIKLDHADADRITGSWSWIAQLTRAARKETAGVVIYRTVYGRTLQMDFENFTQTLTSNGVDRSVTVPNTWTWTKVSQREILWEELPF